MYNTLHLGRQLLRSATKKTSRKLLKARMYFASEAQQIEAERRLRGKEQFEKLQEADVVVVSFGKSGRTWLRVMVSRAYQLRHGLSEKSIIGFDNLHYQNSEIPKIFFTHDNYIKDYTGHTDSKADFYDKKVVFLARDPRDVAVSQFFQWKFRMRPEKKALNEYPEHGREISMFEFLMDPGGGLPKVIDFMNLWATEAPRLKHFHVVRYEDLKATPHETLKGLLDFMGTPANEEQIAGAVEFSSYENMKKMEQKRTFWLSGGRLVPKDRNNPHSYKVRRAKVGGYRDYFDDEQVGKIDALVDQTLSPTFGYGHSAAPGSADAARAQPGDEASIEAPGRT